MAFLVAPPPLEAVTVVDLIGIRLLLTRSGDKLCKPWNMSSNKRLQVSEAIADYPGVHLDAAPEGSRSLGPGDVGIFLHLLHIAEADTRNNNNTSRPG